MIEFLIVEKLVEDRPTWRKVLEPPRDDFHRVQLQAAVDRDEDTAVAELLRLGYSQG